MQSHHPVRELLTEGEVVIENLDVSANHFRHLTVTNRRCIFWSKKKDFITEFDRQSLSSLDFVCWNVWPIGIALMVVAVSCGVAATRIHDDQDLFLAMSFLLGVAGLALLFDYETVSFWVAGRAHPVKVSKTRYVWMKRHASLYGLLRLVRTLSGERRDGSPRIDETTSRIPDPPAQ